MTHDELQVALETAKNYKAEQVTLAELQVDAARQTLASAEARLEAWIEMTPYNTSLIMEKNKRREEAEQSQREAHAKLSSQHDAALKEAHEKGKALLPPEYASKANSLGIAGAFLLAAITTLSLRAIFDVQNEIWLLIAMGTSGVLGLFLGFAFFDANFIVDESLERGIFAKFTAHDVVRQTYSKNSQDQ